MVYTIWYIPIASWYIPSKSGIYHEATFQMESESPAADGQPGCQCHSGFKCQCSGGRRPWPPGGRGRTQSDSESGERSIFGQRQFLWKNFK